MLLLQLKEQQQLITWSISSGLEALCDISVEIIQQTEYKQYFLTHAQLRPTLVIPMYSTPQTSDRKERAQILLQRHHYCHKVLVTGKHLLRTLLAIIMQRYSVDFNRS